ncbi:hypothetical protein Leryth_012929 [Lithospermum erythrorhizon]|nr:hypothetical protein Leryth_012929 [Lithospermum erythrorhizon]
MVLSEMTATTVKMKKREIQMKRLRWVVSLYQSGQRGGGIGRCTQKPKVKNKSVENDEEMIKSDEEIDGSDSLGEENDENGQSWEPSVEGFLKYLVDSKHDFININMPLPSLRSGSPPKRLVNHFIDIRPLHDTDVYFRKTGLERADCIARDLEWFSQGGNSIPEPSNPGITYAKYLEEIAEKTPALFMCHFYNIYFSHIAGGQVIAKKNEPPSTLEQKLCSQQHIKKIGKRSSKKLIYTPSYSSQNQIDKIAVFITALVDHAKVSKKILDERELEFFKWERNEEDLLRGVRENLNMLGEVGT